MKFKDIVINAFRVKELRKKMFMTLMLIIIFRIGCFIPVPGLNESAFSALAGNGMFKLYDMLSGGAFQQVSLFAMTISPYINASIIVQLLTVAIPVFERWQKEGPEGRKKIQKLTRGLTIGLALFQAIMMYFNIQGSTINLFSEPGSFDFFTFAIVILSFTAGTALMMWMGEQINNKGIGNGISILLFAGIIARFPYTISVLGQYWEQGLEANQSLLIFVPLLIVLFLAVIWIITFMQDSERRIPIQYAKRVVGRKMYGGQSSHLPIKVALGGVLPIIFASSILSIPSTIKMFWQPSSGFWASFLNAFSTDGWLYMLLYFIFIIAFAYFYTTIQYNPVEMANNLKQNNGTIPGIRPGKPTVEFISKILSRITLIGALFLAVIALVPLIYAALTGMGGLSMGGTSVIILVGVALETSKQMESQMMMRHYKGFLD